VSTSRPDGLLDLLNRPSPCFIATLMPDGSPQLTDGARESIDEISHKYLGIPYPNFSGNPDEIRVLVTIEADKVTLPAGG